MEIEKILPENFDGIFRFTNNSDEEFVAKYNNKEYRFPANSTSPMIMPEFTAIEIMNIRKKFAQKYAEQQFFNSKAYEHQRSRESSRDKMGMLHAYGQGMSHAGQYSIDDLAPFIQECLVPLPIGKALVREIPKKELEASLSKDDSGNLNSGVVSNDKDLENVARGIRPKLNA